MAAKWPDHKPTWSPWSPNHRPPMLQHPQQALLRQQPFNRSVFPSASLLELPQALPPEQEQQQLLEDLDRLEQEREALITMSNRRHSITTSSNWKTPPQTRLASVATSQSLLQMDHHPGPSSMGAETTQVAREKAAENCIFPSVKNQIRAKLHESIKRSIDSCSIKSDPF